MLYKRLMLIALVTLIGYTPCAKARCSDSTILMTLWAGGALVVGGLIYCLTSAAQKQTEEQNAQRLIALASECRKKIDEITSRSHHACTVAQQAFSYHNRSAHIDYVVTYLPITQYIDGFEALGLSEIQTLFSTLCNLQNKVLPENKLDDHVITTFSAQIDELTGIESLLREAYQQEHAALKLMHLLDVESYAQKFASSIALYQEYATGSIAPEYYEHEAYRRACARAGATGTPFLSAVALEQINTAHAKLIKALTDFCAQPTCNRYEYHQTLSARAQVLRATLEHERDSIIAQPEYRQDAQAKLYAEQNQQMVLAAQKEAAAREQLLREQQKANALKEHDLELRQRELYEQQLTNSRRAEIKELQDRIKRLKKAFACENREVIRALLDLESKLSNAASYGADISASWVCSQISRIRSLISKESDDVQNIFVNIIIS